MLAIHLWKAHFISAFRLGGFPLTLLVRSYGIVVADAKFLFFSAITLISLLYSDADMPSAKAVMQGLIFFFCHGWGWEEVFTSPLVSNQFWRRCKTQYWSSTEKSVTVTLYNYWWSQKMPQAKCNYYLLCWIVSLACVRMLCFACVFPFHACLYYMQLAFIFLLWFQLRKWTPV